MVVGVGAEEDVPSSPTVPKQKKNWKLFFFPLSVRSHFAAAPLLLLPLPPRRVIVIVLDARRRRCRDRLLR